MTYSEALNEAISGWNENPISDEWVFEKFREDFVYTMSPSEAFDAIESTISVLLHQSDESTAIEVLETLIALARQSDTTEMPVSLRKSRDEISGMFSLFGAYANSKLTELFVFYRCI